MRKLLVFISYVLLTASAILAQPKTGKISEGQMLEFDKYFFLGLKEKLINNNAQAEEAFKQALNIDNQNANAWFQLSSVLVLQKKLDLAESACERAVKFDPNNQWYLTQMAGLYKMRSQYLLAAQTQEKLFSITKNVNDLYDLAESYFLNQDYKSSIKALDRAEKIVGPIEQIYLQRQHIYLSVNKVNKALKEFDKLIKLYPEQLRYMGMKGDVLMANFKTKEGVKLYNKVLSIDPNNGYAAFALAEFYHNRFDTAAWYKYLKIGMAGNVTAREKVEVMVQLIPKKELPNHTEQCLYLVDLFIHANPQDATPLMLKGDLYLEQRNFELARNFYKQAVSMDANALMAWEQILFCDNQLQNTNYIIEDCNQIVSAFPTYSFAYLMLANSYLRSDSLQLAVNAANSGLKVIDNDESKIELLGMLAEASHQLKVFATRDSAYDAILQVNPNHVQTLNNWAYYLSLQKVNLNKADSMSLKTIELEPESSFNLDTYGWILFQKKEYLKAKEYIEKSLKLMPDNPEVLEHYGDVLMMLNDTELAMQSYQKAKLLGSKSNMLDRKISEKKYIE